MLTSATGALGAVFDFLLMNPPHWRLYLVFIVARLKPSRFDRSREHPPPPPLRSTATGEYEVETIREHRGTTVRDLEYLVKWLGYNAATWQPPSGKKNSLRMQAPLADAPDAMVTLWQGISFLNVVDAPRRGCCATHRPSR